jgi:hypothetical protein
MPNQAIFAGLVVDENDQPVTHTYVGIESCYVVNDGGFLRHIPSEQVDRQVFDFMQNQIKGNEEIIGEQASKLMGQDDLFTRAIILNQLKNMGKQFENLLQTGIPEEGRAYLGMMGFRVVINLHGEVIEVRQPSASSEDDE